MSEPEPLFPYDGPSIDTLRPSIFEVIADEQLRELFHPVVKYVLSYFAQRYPRYLLRLLHRHDEVSAILLILIERHHLKKHNASLSSYFYNLRYAPTPRIPTPRLDAFERRRPKGLNRRQRWGMIFFLVGLPYLRGKAQSYFERLGGRGEGIDDDVATMLTPPQRIYKALYPYINLAFDLTLLGYDIAYLFERKDDFRPWYRWMGLRLQRKSQDDEDIAPPPSSTQKSSLISNLPPLLPPLLLLLKLSQWWYSPQSPRGVYLTNPRDGSSVLRLIPPPEPLPILKEAGILPLSETGEEDAMPDGEGHENPEAEGRLHENGEAQGANVKGRGHESRSPPPSYSQATKQTNSSPSHRQLSGEVANTEAKSAKLPEYIIPVAEYGTCPICSHKWQNPAILPSGWVVCWRCGWDAIEASEGEAEYDPESGSRDEGAVVAVPMAHCRVGTTLDEDGGAKRGRLEGSGAGDGMGRCPITGMRVRKEDLRRVLV